MTDQPLRIEEQGDGTVLLTLDRPDRRNALNTELRRRLADTLGGLAGDDSCRVVVLTGAGTTFCAGFDLKELASADPTGDPFDMAYHRAVHTFPKPLVAAVPGPAVAGGMDLALMCDLRIAHSDATFGQPQVRVGIPAAYDLVRSVVAEPVAREICLTGRVFGSEEALAMGVVNRVVGGDPGDVLREALVLASEVAASPGAGAAKLQFLAGQPELFG